MADDEVKPIQALRAVAYTCIALTHFTSFTSSVKLGAYGVSIFFVLSGFLLINAYWERTINISLKDNFLFALNKVKRLYPLYVITMIIHLIGCIFNLYRDKGELSYFVKLCIEAILNLSLLQSWYPDNQIAMSLNGVSWYLSAAVFLYFVFPWILRYIKSNNSFRNIFLGVTCVLLQIIFSAIASLGSSSFFSWATYTFPLYRLGDFIIGCLLGVLYHKNIIIIFDKKIIATICELLLIAFSFLVVNYQTRGGQIVGINRILFNETLPYLTTSAAMIILFAKNRGILTRLLSNKYVVFIGNISPYTFLTHYVINFYLNMIAGVFHVELGIYLVIIKYIVTIFITWVYVKMFHISLDRKISYCQKRE